MKQTIMRDSLVEELLGATEKAIEALRINHFSQLKDALREREQLLIELFGFQGMEMLPGTVDDSRITTETRSYKKVKYNQFQRLSTFEKNMFRLFRKRLTELQFANQHIRRGKRWIDDNQRILLNEHGDHLDRRG